MLIPKFHPLPESVSPDQLPEKFNNPFHYDPHPLCLLAAKEVQAYLAGQKQWEMELQKGKMFGVLIVQDKQKNIGYLAAFSGLLAGCSRQSFFIPPVYDLQKPGGFFQTEEQYISTLNTRLNSLETDPSYLSLQQQLKTEIAESQKIVENARMHLKTAKAERELRRQHQLTETEQNILIRESQYQKASYKRLVQHLRHHIANLETEINKFRTSIEQLKNERKLRSAALQQKLFAQFHLLNARGEEKDLCQIFAETARHTPPAGAGECAAPKLLQYAYLQELTPVAMAEFWWGNSPGTEVRRHGYYYPACKSKCEPILKHMLQGLNVEANPLEMHSPQPPAPEVIYEDEWLLVIHKPAGLLSAPGKLGHPSVYSLIRASYPDVTGPLLVHRLDMDTSGLLLLAKTKEVHKQLQQQFKNHLIKKGYIALLDGILSQQEGRIDLPLCADPADRPRQQVSYKYGKPATTLYKVIEYREQHTLVAFYPVTGRTHQLRVHAAHQLGLNAPIVGDRLYGKKAERLCLHAESLQFLHPITQKRMFFEKKIRF